MISEMTKLARPAVLATCALHTALAASAAPLPAVSAGGALATESAESPRSACAVTLQGHVGGSAVDMALSAGQAFVAVGPRLAVVDTRVANESLLSVSDPFDGSLVDIAVAGRWVLALTVRGTILALAVSPGGEAEPVFRLEGSSSLVGMDADGNRVFVVDVALPGLREYAIDRDGSLSETRAIAVPLVAHDVTVLGTTAFLFGHGVTAIDLAQPGQLRILWSVVFPELVYDVAIYHEHLYVAAGAEGVLLGRITGGESPVLRKWYDGEGGAVALMAANNRVFAGMQHQGLVVLDATAPEAMVLAEVAGWRLPLRIAMTQHGSILVLDAYEGLATVQENWLATRTIETIPVMPVYDAFRTPGRTLAAGFYAGLAMLGDRGPGAVAYYERLATRGPARAVWADAQHVAVAEMEAGVEFFQAFPGGQLKSIGWVDTPGWSVDLAESGDVLYVADFAGGVWVVNVEDPTTPAVSAIIPAQGSATAVAVRWPRLYVATGQDGLQVYELPAGQFVRSVPVTGLARDIELSEDLAYVAAAYGGLRVFRLPGDYMGDHILEVGFFHTSSAWSVSGHGNTVYVGDSNEGLYTLHVEPGVRGCHKTYLGMVQNGPSRA